MPKLLQARAPQDMAEEQKVRKLANSRQAPGDWIMRARMIVHSSGMDFAPGRSLKNWGATLRRFASAYIASTPKG